jgi:pimeloyl-ACP methyl ester carboxylesterase
LRRSHRFAVLLVLLLSTLGMGRASEVGYVRKMGAKTAIIFVHGILGDARETWTNVTTKAYFPALVAADPQFSDVDVYSYEYPTSLIRGTFSIDEVAEHMRLFFESDEIGAYQNLVFVAHSMGGLVTRAYLLKNREAASRTRMIYFYSTPTTGSEIAAVASLIRANPQLSKMKPMESADYLADLQRQWLAADFGIPSYCAYETQKTFGVSVVTQASASNLCTKRLDPINGDHLSVVKPNGTRDVSYLAFRSAYKQAMHTATVEPAIGVLNEARSDILNRQIERATYLHSGEYVVYVDATVVNKDKEFREMDLLETLFYGATARLVGRTNASVEVVPEDCAREHATYRCLLTLVFGDRRPRVGDQLELRFGPLVTTHEILEKTFNWRDTTMVMGHEVKGKAASHVAADDLLLEINRFNWLIVSDAEILSGEGNQSLLKLSVRNPTDQARSTRELTLDAAQTRGGICTGDQAEKDVRLKLDWEKVVAGLPGGASLTLRGMNIPVRAKYNPQSVCIGYHLTASIPMFELIEPKSVKQVFIKISEVPAKVSSRRIVNSERVDSPPKRLAAWPAIRIKLEGDGGEGAVPTWTSVGWMNN